MSQSQTTSRKHDSFDFRPRLFLSESILFLSVQVLGLYIGFIRFGLGEISNPETGTAISFFLVSFVFATIILILLLKFLKGKLFFKGLMAFLIFMGSWIVLSTFVADIIAIPLSLLLITIRFLKPNVLTQNFAMLFALSGIGATLGLMLPIVPVLVILAVLSVYDVIAVYHTKHMVSLFSNLIKRGAHFSMIIPEKASNLHEELSNVQPGEGRFILLGTGDIAFPLLLAVSSLRYSILSPFAVIAGAFIGLVIIHLLLIQKGRGAIPALPPIAALSIIGFLISTIV